MYYYLDNKIIYKQQTDEILKYLHFIRKPQ